MTEHTLIYMIMNHFLTFFFGLAGFQTFTQPAYLVSLGDTLIRLADILEDIESAEQYYEDALELFDECLKSHPNDPDALEGLQRCEMELDSLFNS